MRFALAHQKKIGLWASQYDIGALECLYLENRPQLQVLFRKKGTQVPGHAKDIAQQGATLAPWATPAPAQGRLDAPQPPGTISFLE